MTESPRRVSGAVSWPPAGVVRVHFDPAALPRLDDEPGANRFDDPRPRTLDRFMMRYAATTLRGCLLELLASLRGNAAAEDRITAVDCNDPDLLEGPAVPKWQPIADYLEGRRVATITGKDLAVVSINDPALQHELNEEPAVRAVLDTPAARQALLPRHQAAVALDNAAVRLASDIGRYITQACALALYDRPGRPDAIHFRSRHDDTEDCWAIYDHAHVEVGGAQPLSPHEPAHAAALTAVATLWNLPLPPAWK